MSAQPGVTRIGQQEQIAVAVVTDPRGRTEYPASPKLNVAIHLGRSVYMACSRGGDKHRGLGVHGDIDIIPPWTASVWEPDDVDTALVVSVDLSLVEAVAEDLGVYPDRVEIRNRFQIRDPQIENIGWAMKAEMETGYPGGRVFRDSLGTALAAYLLERHSSLGRVPPAANGSFAAHQLKKILAFIEENLDKNLSLTAIALVAGVSPSSCKLIFRGTMGLPLHQYVVQRRVERARILLTESELAISEVALQTGFAHQSHLARHMKRMLGYTPAAVKREIHK
ncbi:MAG TPA: AraC family transcriptional regulator [Edaphobacter sp.]|nr:AraC family transcriptional regulator [Edaphobacter sp.]